jgi:hypothetical protein
MIIVIVAITIIESYINKCLLKVNRLFAFIFTVEERARQETSVKLVACRALLKVTSKKTILVTTDGLTTDPTYIIIIIIIIIVITAILIENVNL